MVRVFANSQWLPEDYYTAIGEIIFRWAQLEYQMQEIIWRAMRLDNKQGRTLTIGMDARTLSAIVSSLHKRWLDTPQEKQRAGSIAKGVRKLADFRNNIAHGSWQFPEGGNQKDVWLIYQREDRILPKAKQHEPPFLRRQAKILAALNRKAQDLIYDLDIRNEETP